MKKIFYLVLICFLYSCSIKSQIINIKDQGLYDYPTTGQYYKDVDNALNTFEGLWLYVNRNISLKFILLKKINQFNGSYNEDLIIGGYEYKVNGVVLVNTIPEMSTIYLNQRKHKVEGNLLIKNDFYPPCPECLPNEYRLRLSFQEPVSTLVGKLIIGKIMVGSQEAIKLNLSGAFRLPHNEGTPPQPDDFLVPSGEYILIKQ